MAALIPEARAARIEAVRLRYEARALKHTLRATAARSRNQLLAAEEARDLVLAHHYELLPSPWSSLRWRHQDEALDSTLVPLPSLSSEPGCAGDGGAA